jgi:hypothetical protein
MIAPGAVRGPAPELYIPDRAEREDLGAFTARVVRLDPSALVRLRLRDGQVVSWAPTPFDVLVTRAVRGELSPADLTVPCTELLAALAVVRDVRVEPGRPADGQWHAELPEAGGWRVIEEVPAPELAALADQGIELARTHGQPHAHGTAATVPPAGLMDQVVLTATGDGMRVQVPMRCLFALSGMGFLGGDTDRDRVRVSANDSWMRLDARYGAVVRRRRTLLPLLLG